MATTLSPRSCPSSPGFATTTRIFRSAMAADLSRDYVTLSVMRMSGAWIEQMIL